MKAAGNLSHPSGGALCHANSLDGNPRGCPVAWCRLPKVDVAKQERVIAKRVDALIAKTIPGVRRAIKWRKPSQPLGVPFYGLPDQGWIVAMWSFKDSLGVGFIAGTLLDPEPPVAKMAGTWNRGSMAKARRIDIPNESEFDESQMRSWLEQARELPGWGKGSVELD
jgi:hypothetical protein